MAVSLQNAARNNEWTPPLKAVASANQQYQFRLCTLRFDSESWRASLPLTSDSPSMKRSPLPAYIWTHSWSANLYLTSASPFMNEQVSWSSSANEPLGLVWLPLFPPLRWRGARLDAFVVCSLSGPVGLLLGTPHLTCGGKGAK